MNLEKHTFDSGLRVYVDHIPHALTTSANIVVMAGAYDESEDEAGLAHLVEHVVHKQTASFADKNALALYAEEQQYSWNANTGPERTLYLGRGPNFSAMLQGLGEVVTRPALQSDHIAEEVAVVTREARMALDSDDARAYYATAQHMFGMPYGRPVIGYADRLGYDPDEVRDFYRRYYVPRNMSVVTSGRVSADEVFSMVEEHINPHLSESIAAESAPRAFKLSAPETGERGRFGVARLSSGDVNAKVAIGVPVNEVVRQAFLSERRHAFGIASSLISAHIFRRLREDRQLSYDGSYTAQLAGHPNAWSLGANVTCDRDKVEACLNVMHAAIQEAPALPARLRESYISGTIGGLLVTYDEIDSRAAGVISRIQSGQEPLELGQVIEELNDLTEQDVKAAAEQLAELHQTTEAYEFVSADAHTLKNYRLLEPKM